MRVAVQISGAPRTILHCAKNIQETLQQYNPDYYLLLWNDDLSEEEQKAIVAEFKHVFFCFLHTKDFSYLRDKRYTDGRYYEPGNVVSQAYSWKLCNDFRHSTNIVYDIVIRMRPDIKFIACPSLTDNYPTIQGRNILVPNHSNFSGTNDQVAIGNPCVIDAYCDCFNYIIRSNKFIMRQNRYSKITTENYIWIAPEYFLRCNLEERHVAIIKTPFEYRIIREAYINTPLTDIPQDNSFNRNPNRL